MPTTNVLPESDRINPDDRGSVPPPDLRSRPDGRVVQAAARHGHAPTAFSTGTSQGKRYLDAHLGDLRRLGRAQQPPGDRGDPAAARLARVFAAHARDQPAGRSARQPAGRARARATSPPSNSNAAGPRSSRRRSSLPASTTSSPARRASTRSSAAINRGTARRWLPSRHRGSNRARP